MFNIKQTIGHLQQSNHKAYYLAFLRVALSIWFLKELLFRWPAFDMLYSNHSFLNMPSAPGLFFFRLDPEWFRDHHMLVVYTCIALLLLNIFGIGRNLVSFLLFIALTLLYSINNRFTNSGDEMSMILVFYLSFANTFSHFILGKQKSYPPAKQALYNLVSNLAAYSIIANLCIAYFMAGLYKSQDPYWLNGKAIHYYLNDHRYSIFAGDKYVETPSILVYIVTYGTMLFELSFPFLIYFRRSRNVAVVIGLLMHLGIYIFLMIYGMSVVFIIQYGLFFSNEEITSAVEKVKKKVWYKRRTLTDAAIK